MTEARNCRHGLALGTCSICSGRNERENEPHESECKDCGAPIIWVRSERDKAMPIDAEPGGDPDKARFRKERTEQRDGKTVGIVHFVRDAELEANTRPMYSCHFDTCSARPPKNESAGR